MRWSAAFSFWARDRSREQSFPLLCYSRLWDICSFIAVEVGTVEHAPATPLLLLASAPVGLWIGSLQRVVISPLLTGLLCLGGLPALLLNPDHLLIRHPAHLC